MLKKIMIRLTELLLTISLFFFLVVLVFFTTIGSKKYMLTMLNETDYYDSIYNYLKSTIEGHTIQLDLDEDTFNSLFSKEKVKEDVNILVDGIYENKKVEIDSSSISDKIEEIVTNRLKENNRAPSSDEQKAIEQLKKLIGNIYQKGITYSSSIITKLGDNYAKVASVKWYIIFILLGIVIFLGGILLLLNKKLKNKIRSISTATLATSFILLAINILLRGHFQNISFFNSAFTSLAVSTINNIFNHFLIIGIILCILSLASIYLSSRVKKD